MSTRRPLSDILPAGGGGDDDLDRLFRTEAAADFAPLPAGTYEAVAEAGELSAARTGTRCYKVKFRVLDGGHAGRLLWLDRYLTPAADKYTRRDMAKLGIHGPDDLRRPLLGGRLKVVLRTGNDGVERNEVKDVAVVRVQEPAADPFAPPPAGDAAEPPAGDAAFPFGVEGGAG